MLNGIWLSFFLIAFFMALYQWVIGSNAQIFADLMQATFDMSKLSVEVAIGLIGLLCFWLGLFRIAEQAGLVRALSRFLTPLFQRLMPEVPAGHPAIGSVTMNIAANMLGLDNAATPIGLKAMKDLQSINPHKEVASNAQILFLVINTSSVTLLPVTIFMYRAQLGSMDPTAVFVPILLATTVSTLVGLLSVALIQRLKLWDPIVLAYFGAAGLLLAGFIGYFVQLPADELPRQSALIGNLIIFSVIISFLSLGFWRKVPVYESFIEGAKEGFQVAVTIIPYLVAMLVGIGVFRASGALDQVLAGIRWLVSALGGDTAFVDALPTALIKPFSGSGARAMMIETMQTHGVDSFAARVAAIIQGSTETTFYVLAVYFGSVGIKRVRYAVGCGLLADLAGVIAAIFIGYWFFG